MFFILQIFLLCSYYTHLLSNKKFLVFTYGGYDLPEGITIVNVLCLAMWFLP